MEAKEDDKTRIQNLNGSRPHTKEKRRQIDFIILKTANEKTMKGRPQKLEFKKKIHDFVEAMGENRDWKKVIAEFNTSRENAYYHWQSYKKNTLSTFKPL